jgi:hypothetical protein
VDAQWDADELTFPVDHGLIGDGFRRDRRYSRRIQDWRAWAPRLRALDSALPQAIPAPPVERSTKPLAVEAEGMRREDRRTA